MFTTTSRVLPFICFRESIFLNNELKLFSFHCLLVKLVPVSLLIFNVYLHMELRKYFAKGYIDNNIYISSEVRPINTTVLHD